MFTNVVSSIALCRTTPAPLPFRRRQAELVPSLRAYEALRTRLQARLGLRDYVLWEEGHRDEPLLAAHREDGVVAARAARCGVDEEVDQLVDDRGRGRLGEHDVQVGAAEDLLEGVERQPTQFAFDEIWAILHDGLELDVPVAALPAGDEVEHVRAVGGAAVLPALGAGERDAERGEHGEVRDLVPHAEEAREEVDLARDGRDGQEAGGADDEQGEYCLVGEVGVDVGRLLQDDDVPPGPLGGGNLPRAGVIKAA